MIFIITATFQITVHDKLPGLHLPGEYIIRKKKKVTAWFPNQYHLPLLFLAELN